ncbi:GntR family transcriptional regulator [Arthrobacter sp. NPDC056886]|uniref:GntR family transcriptional regulator n=1 Tax=Arthrobacter sp. NPDC056886 TaxID=3345960 RepID=UPI00366FB3BA
MTISTAGDATMAKVAASEVYSALRQSILDGDIAPGTRINIDAVSRRLGVSQTPVREALQHLEGDNLLVYYPGRGYSTTPLLSLPELRSLFEFRLLVEPWAARSAAVDRLSNPSAALRAELEVLERQVDDTVNVRQDLLAHDARFHDLILASAGNPVVQQAYVQTHCHLHMFRLYPSDLDSEVTLMEHRGIRDAIAAADPVAAEEAMSAHLRSSFHRFARAFGAGPVALPAALPGAALGRMTP